MTMATSKISTSKKVKLDLSTCFHLDTETWIFNRKMIDTYFKIEHYLFIWTVTKSWQLLLSFLTTSYNSWKIYLRVFALYREATHIATFVRFIGLCGRWFDIAVWPANTFAIHCHAFIGRHLKLTLNKIINFKFMLIRYHSTRFGVRLPSVVKSRNHILMSIDFHFSAVLYSISQLTHFGFDKQINLLWVWFNIFNITLY